MIDKRKKRSLTERLMSFDGYGDSPKRYRLLRRNISFLMISLSLVPLILMAMINYHQYQRSLKKEIINPDILLVSKTRHSLEFFLKERLSLIKTIASFYSYNELIKGRRLNQTLLTLKKEFTGFVDLGVIDGESGRQTGYAGPYNLLGKDYSQQEWFHEVVIKGTYISDVFMGYRKFPHITIAVQRLLEDGKSWIVRTTIDTTIFKNLIGAMGLGAESDAFILNSKGVFQTDSRLYGRVLEKCPIELPSGGYGTYVAEQTDPEGRQLLLTYSRLSYPEYTLVIVKPKSQVLRAWYALKGDLFLVFSVGSLMIVLVALKISGSVVDWLKESDMKRELAFRELQHHHKLSSIGRLAAGVAHEINNPLAIINEKAGLIKDLIEIDQEFKDREKFLSLVGAIIQSVDRCRTITHRLLGFAKRMEVEVQAIDINDLIKEVIGFLEKEALYKNVDLQLELAEDLPAVESDRGQLQQVFLNILNNAMAAVEEGGQIIVRTAAMNNRIVTISIKDDGCGMSEDVRRHIFEPFFTTKKEYGTGLGLSITYGIVKKLGGEIEVMSRESEGSTFVVYLPIRPNEKVEVLDERS